MAPSRRTWVLRLLGVVAVGSIAASLILPLRAGAIAAQQAADVPTQLKQVKATLADAKADAEKLADALDRATQALNQAENELAEAELLRLSAHARGVQANAALQDATERVGRLRGVLGDRARGIYIGGDPAGLAALVQSGEVDNLLNQVAMLDHLAKESNDSLADLVVAEKDYALAKVALRQAEDDARRAGTVIRRKIAEATELRDVRVQAKEALDEKIRRLEGEAAVLRETQRQRAAARVGFQAGGGKCDLSGTSDAEYFIIMKESRGDPTARNPNSTAFGLGQLLLDLRQRILGADYDTIDCGKQLLAFRTYVRERYGTAEAAQAFWLAHGWY
jgi:septal ring factor EnvC (AmiA/AmiB activator)